MLFSECPLIYVSFMTISGARTKQHVITSVVTMIDIDIDIAIAIISNIV